MIAPPTMGRSRQMIRSALVAGTLLLPRVAAACPYCTTSLDKLSVTLRLVGLFLLCPFLIAGTVILVIRKLVQETAEGPLDPSTAPPSPPATGDRPPGSARQTSR